MSLTRPTKLLATILTVITFEKYLLWENYSPKYLLVKENVHYQKLKSFRNYNY